MSCDTETLTFLVLPISAEQNSFKFVTVVLRRLEQALERSEKAEGNQIELAKPVSFGARMIESRQKLDARSGPIQREANDF